MKKITLLVAGLLLSGNLAVASETMIFSGRPKYEIDYRQAEPIVFMERGIEFLVFPDGAFDFNTEPYNTRTANTYYRHGDGRTNATYGAPGTQGNGVRIEHDYSGRVRRVGNVFINYDARGRVKRIGTVYMAYNNFALTQIGNLHLTYNRSGHLVDVAGYVNANNRSYTYEPYYGGHGNYNSTRGDEDESDKVYYRKSAESTRG